MSVQSGATFKASRKRGRPRAMHELATDQAAAYGISVPVLSDKADRFLSPNDVGKVLNVTGEAVKQWIYRRKLPAVRLANGFWKIRVADFESFLKARTQISRRYVLITDAGGAGIQEIECAAWALGLQVILAHNYPDALLKALDHFPSLFVISLSRNDIEGLKFAAKIKSNKSLRSFPILFIGDADFAPVDTENLLKCNAKGLLLRPLNAVVVQKEIDAIIRRTF
jgi:hypothetical protein